MAERPGEYVRIQSDDYILILNHCLPEERTYIWSLLGSFRARYAAVDTPLFDAITDLYRGIYDCLRVIDDETDAPVAVSSPGNCQSVVDITSSKDSSCYTISESLTDSQEEEEEEEEEETLLDSVVDISSSTDSSCYTISEFSDVP